MELFLYFLFNFAITSVIYILYSWALYRIAKNRGLKNLWWAWAPFLSNLLFGEIIDNINKKKGVPSNYKKFFTYLSSTIIASIIVLIPTFFSAEMRPGSISVPFTFVYFILFAALITFCVSYFFGLYRLVVEYDKKNAMLFLALSILFLSTL